MIVLSNGHSFEYIASSGALGFDAKGWPWEKPLIWLGYLDPLVFTAVTKTLTFQPQEGNWRWYNPFKSVRFLKDGVVNANGLSNPGIKWWCSKVGSRINRANNDGVYPPLAISLAGTQSELTQMAFMIKDFDVVAIEINISCHNDRRTYLSNPTRIARCCNAVKRVSGLPIILKISTGHNIEPLGKELEGLIDAFSINSVRWELVFPKQKSPLSRFGGGAVSGKIAQQFTWPFVEKIINETSIPVIGPSVWEYDDIKKLRQMGARAISFGSIFLRYPWRPTQFARRDQKEIRSR